MLPLSIAAKTVMVFYQDHRSAISVPNADKTLFLGNFNAQVEQDHEAWGAFGES